MEYLITFIIVYLLPTVLLLLYWKKFGNTLYICSKVRREDILLAFVPFVNILLLILYVIVPLFVLIFDKLNGEKIIQKIENWINK